MAEILALIFAAAAVASVVFRISEKKKWRDERDNIQQQYEVLQSREEAAAARVRAVSGELEQERTLRAELEDREEILVQKDTELLEETRRLRSFAVRIHLYAQLVKEQCSTDAAKKQCDIILSECEKMLEKDM